MISVRKKVDLASPALRELLARGSRDGCIEFSELNEAIEALELDEAQVQSLQDQIEERGIPIRDDCGHEDAESTRYRNDELASTTTDALQLFLAEARRHP